jgi:hypothetical protein
LTPSPPKSKNSTSSTEKQASDPASIFPTDRLAQVEDWYRRSQLEDQRIRELLAHTQDQIRALYQDPPGSPGTRVRNTVLNAEEVCSIIESCKDAGVSVLKFRGLYLRFGHADHARRAETAPGPGIEETTTSSPTDSDEMEKAAVEAHERTLLRDELKVRAQQIDELPITDPLEYERKLANGELEDDASGTADEEA